MMNVVVYDVAAAGADAPQTAEELLPQVYGELCRLAARRIARETDARSLEATALVHDAYLRLAGDGPGQVWNGRGHFFAAAAEAMRRILVERARRRKSLKAGGKFRRHDLSDITTAARGPDIDQLAVGEALTKLARRVPRQAELVKLRFFTGLTIQEAAGVLGVSTTTAENDWARARGWLRREIGAADDAARVCA